MFEHEITPQGVVARNPDTAIQPTAPVVMVVGPFGSGAEELAALLADHLQLPVYDPNKLDALARDREKHDSAWHHLQQGLSSFFDYWLGHLHEKPGMARTEHLLHLQEIIQQVATQGGVIVGVCIHHMLPGEKLFRIRINASANYCAHRLAHIRQCDHKEAVAAFYHMEEEHSQFLHSLFEDGLVDPVVYDVELNAEHLSPNLMLEECLAAMGRRHFLEKAA